MTELSPMAEEAVRRDGYRAVGLPSQHLAVEDARLPVGETFILLHPPSTFSRCFNRDEEGVSAE